MTIIKCNSCLEEKEEYILGLCKECSDEMDKYIERKEQMPKEVLELSDDDTWKPCMMCGGQITQVRKALFTCLKCNQEYISTEEDMRPETKPPFKIIKK